MVPARCLSLAGRKWIDFYDAICVISVCLCCCCKMAASVLAETSGKDVVAEGLLDLLKPAIQQLDLHVHSVR